MGAVALAIFLVCALFYAEAVAQQTQNAADFAALAAAEDALMGTNSCQIAEQAASQNGAELLDCTIEGDEATVSTKKEVFSVLGDLGSITKTATAGEDPNCGK
jgi:secretion/DNA translocation related TadE-like protein